MNTRAQRTDDVGRLAGARLKRGAAAEHVCPDAEVLAAYVDNGLAEAEVERLEAHLSTCVSCRALLARLSPAERPVVHLGAGWRVPRVDPRWLSLAAMLIVGATLWLAWPRSASILPESTTARDSVAAPAVAEAPAPASPPVSPARAQATDQAPAVQAPAARAATPPARVALEKEVARKAEADASLRRSALAAPTDTRARQVAGARRDSAFGAGALAGPAVAAPQPARPAAENAAPKTLADARPAEGQRTASSAPAPQPAPAPTVPAPAVAAAAPPPRAATFEERRESGAGASPAAAANADKLRTGERVDVVAQTPTIQTSTAAVVRPAGLMFAEPEGRLQWRILNGRRIESSSDGGQSWNMSFDKSPAPLLAGSAPALSAAWVCGAKGLVLRRLYPGGWTRTVSPATEDLVAITATSESSARVTTRSGQVFETTDGGATWARQTP